MRSIRILAMLCAFVPAVAAASDAPRNAEPARTARRTPPPPDFVAPGILRQDLFDRNNPNNVRHDWPAPPGQPG